MNVCKNEAEILSNNFEDTKIHFLLSNTLLSRKTFLSSANFLWGTYNYKKSIDIICENTPHNYDLYKGVQVCA